MTNAPATRATTSAPTAPQVTGPTVTDPKPSANGTLFVEDFDQADGRLAGWQTGAASFGLEVVGNKGSTNNETQSYAGALPHGLAPSSDFEIAARVTAPKIASHGGVNVWVVDPEGNGWGVFVGNAVHIQKVTAFSHRNLTNVGVPGETTTGVRTSQIRLTRVGATGLITAYLDGAQWGTITDTDSADVGTHVAIFIRNTQSPTYETTIDDLLVTSVIRAS